MACRVSVPTLPCFLTHSEPWGTWVSPFRFRFRFRPSPSPSPFAFASAVDATVDLLRTHRGRPIGRRRACLSPSHPQLPLSLQGRHMHPRRRHDCNQVIEAMLVVRQARREIAGCARSRRVRRRDSAAAKSPQRLVGCFMADRRRQPRSPSPEPELLGRSCHEYCSLHRRATAAWFTVLPLNFFFPTAQRLGLLATGLYEIGRHHSASA
jgi:hypothetical protein